MSISSTGLYGSASIVNTDIFDDLLTLKEEVTALSTIYLTTTNEHRVDILQNKQDISSNLNTIIDLSNNRITGIEQDITDISNNRITAIEQDITDISNNRIIAIEHGDTRLPPTKWTNPRTIFCRQLVLNSTLAFARPQGLEALKSSDEKISHVLYLAMGSLRHWIETCCASA